MDPRSNDEVSRDIAHKILHQCHDRFFYEKAIQTCRVRGMLHDLDVLRIGFCERLVMKPGSVMEWIADNALYEDDLSFERCKHLMAACKDVLHVGCWLKLLQLVRASSKMGTLEKIEIYEMACKLAGRDLSNGHKIWMEFLGFLDDVEDNDIIDVDALIDDVIRRILAIPFVQYPEVSMEIVDLYQPDNVQDIIGTTQKQAEKLSKLETMCSEPGASKELYLELSRLLRTHCPQDPLINLALYRRWLSRNPEDEKTWDNYFKEAMQLSGFDVQSEINQARRSNPHKLSFWIAELLEYERIDKTVPFSLFPGNQTLLSLEAAKEYTIEFVAYNKRSFGAPDGTLEWREFNSWMESHLRCLESQPELQTAMLICLASIQAQTQGSFDIFQQIESRCIDNEKYWLEQARCLIPQNICRARICLVSGVYQTKVPSVLLLNAWLDFERVHGTRDTYRSVYEDIKQFRNKLHHEAPNRTEKIEAKRQRIEEEEPAPLVVDLALKPELSIHAANIDFAVTEAQLREFFQEHVGPVQAVQLGRKANGESRGFASVEFKEVASVQKALQLDRSRLNGRPLFISRHQVVGSTSWIPAVSHPRGRDPFTLYVSQLPGETVEEDLEGLFTRYGALKEIRLGLEKGGRCKGYAYVEFEDEQSATKALAEHGKLIKGQAINVLISDPSLAPKKQTQKMAMVPPSLSRPKPKARLNLK